MNISDRDYSDFVGTNIMIFRGQIIDKSGVGGGVAPKSCITPVPELCSLTTSPNLEPNSKLTQVHQPLAEVPGVPHLAVHVKLTWSELSN